MPVLDSVKGLDSLAIGAGVVYSVKSTAGRLARPLALRQQKMIGRITPKRTLTVVTQAIPAADMPQSLG